MGQSARAQLRCPARCALQRDWTMRGRDEAVSLQARDAQAVVGPVAQALAEPARERRLEAVLRPVHQSARHAGIERRARQALPGDEIERQGPGELGDAVVEKGRAHLQRERHAGAVELDEKIVRQIGRRVAQHELLGERGRAGASGASRSDAAAPSCCASPSSGRQPARWLR